MDLPPLRLLVLTALAATTLAGAETARLAEAAVVQAADSPYPVTELFPVEPSVNAERGFAVAVNGDWLAMGAPREDYVADNGHETKEAGAVYLFHWSGTTWDQKAKLFADPPQQNAQLGFALAMHNGVLAAGAPGEGAVYLFAEDDGAWGQEKRLTGTEHGVRTFGRALALDGDLLAVGAVGVHGATDGAVYLYEGDSWDFKQMVQPRPRQRGERFGSAVSLAGGVLVVGAPGYDIRTSPPADDAGAVYVFQRGTILWRKKQTLFPPESLSRAGQQFGSAVATDGTHIFAGAPTADPAGAVYGFVQAAGGNWDRQALPELEALAAGEQLGASLALGKDLLVVGAPKPPPEKGTGGLRVFRRKSGLWEAHLLPANTELRDLAGFAVAVDGERVVVGGVLGDQGGGAAGAAWSFHCPADKACAEEAEAVARDDLSGKRVGASVALTKDFMAVGAPESDELSTGSVYLYRRAGRGWRQEKRLTSSYPGDGFGSSVALEGSLLAVGTPQPRFSPVSPPDDFPHGSVDLFVHHGSSWVFEATLAPPPAFTAESAFGKSVIITDNLAFGTSVAIAEGVVAVGAPGHDPGAVYLFQKGSRGWIEAGVLTAPAKGFGSAVSLHGGVLAIGAPGGDGAVYVSVRGADGWTQPRPLPDPLPGRVIGEAEGRALGSAVAVGDGVIAAGAPGFLGHNEAGAPLFGAVFLFEGDGTSWGTPIRLSALAPRRFGSSVALLGNRLVVGAPGQDGTEDPNDLDRAAVFERGGDGVWKVAADLDALQPPHGDEFGYAVALSEGFFVVTSPGPARGDRVTVFDLLHPKGGPQ